MLRFDAATATDRGNRPYQEDAVLCDFIQGSDSGFAVIADGMGGHAAGDVASQIATEASFLLLRSLRRSQNPDPKIGPLLRSVVQQANELIGRHSAERPDTQGMGTTFVATVIQNDALHWISVGDSPLYLFREGALRQINQDHSLAPQIDLLVASGLMSAEDGRLHPDRNVLTSVLVGQDIAKVDVPNSPLTLKPGDILLIASDGIQTLDHAQIEALVTKMKHRSSIELATCLLDNIRAIDDPEQDNVSFAAIRVLGEMEQTTPMGFPKICVREATPKILSFFKNHFHAAR